MLTEQLRNFVAAVVSKYLYNPEDVKDVTQSVLLRVHESLGKFRQESKFTSWVYRIACNGALMFLRKQKRENRIFFPDDLSGKFPVIPSRIAEQVGAKQELTQLLERLDNLPNKLSAEIFFMRHVEGISEKEIAEKLHLPLTVVKGRAFKTYHALIDK